MDQLGKFPGFPFCLICPSLGADKGDNTETPESSGGKKKNFSSQRKKYWAA